MKKFFGIVVGGVLGILVLLFVIGTIAGPPKNRHAVEGVANGSGAQNEPAVVAQVEKPPATSRPSATDRPAATARPAPTDRPSPPPTVDPVSQQWGEFLRYGPELASFLKRSDALNATHIVLVPPSLTAANRTAFYTATERAAQQTGVLRLASVQVKVPGEATTFRNSVTLALSRREDSFKKLGVMINTPGPANESAYQTAKGLADNSALPVVTEMLRLCGTMKATATECNRAAGL